MRQAAVKRARLAFSLGSSSPPTYRLPSKTTAGLVKFSRARTMMPLGRMTRVMLSGPGKEDVSSAGGVGVPAGLRLVFVLVLGMFYPQISQIGADSLFESICENLRHLRISFRADTTPPSGCFAPALSSPRGSRRQS